MQILLQTDWPKGSQFDSTSINLDMWSNLSHLYSLCLELFNAASNKINRTTGTSWQTYLGLTDKISTINFNFDIYKCDKLLLRFDGLFPQYLSYETTCVKLKMINFKRHYLGNPPFNHCKIFLWFTIIVYPSNPAENTALRLHRMLTLFLRVYHSGFGLLCMAAYN